MAAEQPENQENRVRGSDQKPCEQPDLAKVIQSFDRQYKSAKENQAKHDKNTLFWGRVAGIGVWIYTLLTFAITGIAFWQARLTANNFQRAQRAYILVEDAKGAKVFERGQRARWDIRYVNYGKSPSVREATDAHVWTGRTATARMNAFFQKLPRKKPNEMANFITPPNANGGPNGFHYVTLFSSDALTTDDVTFMKTHDAGVVAAGRVWYQDIFGNSYWTDFCRYTLITGAVSDCPIHNDIH